MRIAVVVPGIMGSVLWYDDSSGQRTEIWGNNLRANYVRLLANPTLLNWSGNAAQGSLLERLYTSQRIPWPKVTIWTRLLDFLESHGEFGGQGRLVRVGYDWRQSLLDSALDLASSLDDHAKAIELETATGEEVKFTFITHSMGGLLVRCAIGLGAISPRSVDRLVHIGSPLEGAPGAFAAAYRTGGLPFLRELSHLIRWKNSQQFFEHLLATIQTFPSIYQLMPPEGNNFLFYSPARRENPFDDRFASSIPAPLRRVAKDAHEVLREAERSIVKEEIVTYTIYTEHHGQRETELEYRVESRSPPAAGYRILEVLGRTSRGDGTVPFESAAGASASARRKPLLNIDHAYMCNEKKVVELFPTIL